MARSNNRRHLQNEVFPKAPTGIRGLDEITGGGLPKGRPTLVSGSAGCGKTILAMEFIVRGAQEFGEPGVFMSFEETSAELTQNFRSLGYDLDDLAARKLLALDHVRLEPREVEETGEYDLEGLFVRLAHAIETVGAKRVALDTIEALFSGLSDEMTLRAELRRLFRWLKERGVTAVITAERGGGEFTRRGLEEYVSDCVILLDHRVDDQITTRRMRIVKYRGSTHGTNEYPFLIDEQGISVLPITSLGLEHPATNERVPTGIEQLDQMFGGEGYYRGSSVLITGTAGTGKTSVAANFVNAACARGERAIYFSFEESEQQVLRNMRSIGLDLGRWVRKGLLRFYPARPTLHGLERHLVLIHKLVSEFDPGVVVIDPITNLTSVGGESEVRSALTRLLDFFKSRQITALFTSLARHHDDPEHSEVGVSSLMDTWILLDTLEGNGERNRGLYILKSRGMAHSNQIREFQLTDRGVRLVDIYLGPGGVLAGAARAEQEARERSALLTHRQKIERRQRDLERKRKLIEAQIAALRAEFETEQDDLQKIMAQEEARDVLALDARAEMARLRGGRPRGQHSHGGESYGDQIQETASRHNHRRKRAKAPSGR
ncbi:MAG TPA: circadian clock protein KaiC [Blastocatellia bacterium]|nr:circadian clock protein KaiC [Blastocatellia bacterium]